MRKWTQNDTIKQERALYQCFMCTTVAPHFLDVSYQVPWLLLLIEPYSTHAHLNHFYHPFYSGVTYLSEQLGQGLEMRLSHYHHRLPSYHPIYLDQHGEYEEQYSLRSHVD